MLQMLHMNITAFMMPPESTKHLTPLVHISAGGTSLSSPIFAALMALKQQQRGKVYGFANPLFYSKPQVFYDIKNVKPFFIYKSKISKNRYYAGSDLSLVATRGYDNITGLGTPGSKFWTVL